MGLSKASYYKSVNPEENFLKKYAHLKSLLEDVITEHPGYGIKRIKSELEEEYKVVVGRDTLGKLLKLWGLNLKRKIQKYKPNQIQKFLSNLMGRANLVKRLKEIKPLDVITSDITELEYGGGKAYLCVHMDQASKVVLGYSLSLNMKKQLVIDSYKMALVRLLKLKEDISRTIFHSDQGSQYTSYSYVNLVLSQMRISYSRKGTPTDNPSQESFFGRFKQDNADEILEIETFERLENFVRKRLKYYNEKRRHTSLGNVAPARYLESVLAHE